MALPNAYVAVESFRPLWNELVRIGRIVPEDHPTASRVLRDDQEAAPQEDKEPARQAISLKVVDQVLVDADVVHRLHELYLVTRNGEPLSRFERRKRAERRQKNVEAVPDLIGEYRKQRGDGRLNNGRNLPSRGDDDLALAA